MTVAVLNVATIAEALVQLITNWPGLQKLESVTVERGVLINEDPARCPWVGVYPLGVDYVPRALGQGAGFRYQRPTFAIITQAATASLDEGDECQDRLEALNAEVIAALLSDSALGGTVNALLDVRVQYAGVVVQGDKNNFQSAIITITGEKPVSGG